MSTEAQEEFQQFVDKNNQGPDDHIHPEDRLEYQREAALDDLDLDEEDEHRASQIDAAMRMPAMNGGGGADPSGAYKLPPASFDSGRATGVKGVIADARDYESARKSTFMNRVRHARRSVFGLGDVEADAMVSDKKSDMSSSDGELDEDEEAFLSQWREARRRQMEGEARPVGASVRTRRTSPSARIYGRFDTVDALGYLDAIEKVGRETVVLVYVYDEECQVSSAVESALRPLVRAYPTVHFVKVHYDDIEFDNAAVPAILAYRNQGDLFANLTGLIEMLPDDDALSTEALQKLLQQNNVL
ncbi:phosducin [Ophiostoma piceae UAMH 11346]|uniref:Phosducin n=1 Tax=Ophiostoma piceae (strain UAMH 11346) TaxID=1262450 RepID=S3CLE4_OPHP1|nr:phosducin [Ophiostoma piceae UAMH 11346]